MEKENAIYCGIHFTIMPNIIRSLGLDIYEIYFYWEIIGICGESENRSCCKSIRTLSKEIGISERKIQYIKEKLSKPFKELGGNSLIKVIKRQKDDGSRDTDLITIQEII